MLEPRIIEFLLTKVQKEIGESLTLANNYFRLVKPTEENLIRYSNLERLSKKTILFDLLNTPIKIFLELIKSMAIAVIKSSESASFEAPAKLQAKRIFVSHYTHAQKPSQPDVFFDRLPAQDDLIFYHNNTLLNRKKIMHVLSKGAARPNIVVTTKSLGICKTVSLQSKNLYISLKMLRAAIIPNRFSLIERKILISASSSQVSRQTVVNQVNLKRLGLLLSDKKPESLIITLEGHAYEALYIELIHRKYPDIQLMVFQHAPVVPEQFGLMKNLLRLKSSDVILSSGEVTKDYFESLNLKPPVRLLGSPKWKPVVAAQKSEELTTILGAAEGTLESLESFAKLFQGLNEMDLGLKLILRVHPAMSSQEIERVLSRLHFGKQLILSDRQLEEDLRDSHFCIYRSSAVSIEGLAYGVYPLFYNPVGNQALNPLYFAKLEVPVFRSLSDFREFFLNLRGASSIANNRQKNELIRIGATYYSKLDPRALDRL
jgi:hypothetical protein